MNTVVNSREFGGSSFPEDRTMFEEKLLLGSLGIRCDMRDDHYRISLTDGGQVLQVSKNQMQHTLPGIRFLGSEEPTFTFSQAYNHLAHIQEFLKFPELLKRSREKKQPHVLHRKSEDRYWQLQSFPLKTHWVFCAWQTQRDPSFGAGNRWVGLAKLPWGVCFICFQVRVQGAWGTMCLPVPEEPTHSLRQWSIQAALCFSVPLEVKEAWKPDRTVCVRY